ncbi:hypothetical protein [Oleiagrimonas sp.]|uniref:hypothetical protein n=1 Tax=Oleiagrimonas sp. TaxID=2010330 RepID=UPI0026236603|nr:hypothetical protein [Oleiagrimonas sp.]
MHNRVTARQRGPSLVDTPEVVQRLETSIFKFGADELFIRIPTFSRKPMQLGLDVIKHIGIRALPTQVHQCHRRIAEMGPALQTLFQLDPGLFVTTGELEQHGMHVMLAGIIRTGLECALQQFPGLDDLAQPETHVRLARQQLCRRIRRLGQEIQAFSGSQDFASNRQMIG